MLCEDCDRARRSSDYRLFDLKCLWCGARYARQVRTREGLQLPAQVAGQEMSRRQWFDHVVKAWTDWGHDQAKLLDLARGDATPFAPVGGRRADDQEGASPRNSGAEIGAMDKRRGRPRAKPGTNEHVQTDG